MTAAELRAALAAVAVRAAPELPGMSAEERERRTEEQRHCAVHVGIVDDGARVIVYIESGWGKRAVLPAIDAVHAWLVSHGAPDVKHRTVSRSRIWRRYFWHGAYDYNIRGGVSFASGRTPEQLAERQRLTILGAGRDVPDAPALTGVTP